MEDAECLRLLHVDDHATVVTPLASRLEALGEFRVTVERDPAAALGTLESTPFDCVLLAESVEGTSASEFCRRVRRAGVDCPVLVLSEDPAAAVDAGVLEAGGTDVVDATSEAFLDLLRRRVHLVADVGAVEAVSSQRLLADLPLGAFAAAETVTYANEAFEALADGDVRPGATTLAEALACPECALDPAAADPSVVETDDRTLALWLAEQSGQGDDVVGAVCDLAAGSGVLEDDRERAAMLDSLLSSLPLAVLFRDREGRYVATSEHVTRLGSGRTLRAPDGSVHHAPADVVGKTDHDLYPTALADDAVAEHRRAVDDEEPTVDGRGRYVLGDEPVSLGRTTAPWYDGDGAVVGSVAAWFEHTEAERAASEAAVYRAAFELVGDGVLPAMAAALEERAAEGEDAGEREARATSDERLAALLDDLRRIVRIAGRDVDAGEPLELEAAARDAWSTVAELTDADCSLAVHTDAVLRADRRGLGQLLVAAFENALEHGADSVTVGTSGDGFVVADDGAEIPPVERAEALSYGSSRAPESRGAGLAVADLVATAHGWSLSIADGADGGTRVEVEGVQFL